MLEGKVGIACPTCGIKLRVTQGWAIACSLFWMMMLPGTAVLIADVLGPNKQDGLKSVVAVVVVGFWFIVQSHIPPRLARLRVLEPDEIVVYPLEEANKSRENDISDEETVDELEADSVGDKTAQAWICSRCQEENPAKFLMCWNCQTPRSSEDVNPKGNL